MFQTTLIEAVRAEKTSYMNDDGLSRPTMIHHHFLKLSDGTAKNTKQNKKKRKKKSIVSTIVTEEKNMVISIIIVLLRMKIMGGQNYNMDK